MAVSEHLKHERAEAALSHTWDYVKLGAGCRSDSQCARRAEQTVSALPSLTCGRGLAGRRALCRGGSRGRLLVICHLLLYLHKHKHIVTQWGTVSAQLSSE